MIHLSEAQDLKFFHLLLKRTERSVRWHSTRIKSELSLCHFSIIFVDLILFASSKGYDSWGEEESEDDEPYISYPQMPYGYPSPFPTPGYSTFPNPTMPFFMYPMMLPPQPAPRKSKGMIQLQPIFLVCFVSRIILSCFFFRKETSSNAEHARLS